MSTFKIIKKGANNFWHWFNNDAKKVAISSFAVVLEEVSQTFSIVYINGANVPQQAVNVLDIEVIDETDTSDVETFTNVIDLRARLVELGYTAYLIGGGIDNITGLIAEGTNVTITGDGTLANPYVINASGGGGAVDSVNGQTGVVVLDADDVGAEPTRGSNDNYVTDAQLVIIGNTSGTNSGDNATNTTSNTYADAKVASELASFKTANFLDFTSSGQTQMDAKVDKTTWTDYSALSTIVGWSSFAKRHIYYKIIDGYMLVDFYLEGTSNSTSVTFTLPNNSEQGFSVLRPSGYNVNNGLVFTNSARIIILNGTNVVTITRDFTGSSWTGSGTKAIAGQISFKI